MQYTTLELLNNLESYNSDVIYTNGFYEKCGVFKYKISNIDSSIFYDSGFGFFINDIGYIKLNNTSTKMLIPVSEDGIFNMLCIGLKDSSTLDNTLILRAGFMSGFKKIITPIGQYGVSNSILIPIDVSVDFCNSTFIPLAGMINKFMFLNIETTVLTSLSANYTESNYNWTYSGEKNIELKNINIKNNNLIVGVKSFFVAKNNPSLKNIRSNYMYQTIKFADEYIDNGKIDNIMINIGDYSQISTYSNYQIEKLNNSGDCWEISNLTGLCKMINLQGYMTNFKLNNIINGDINIKNCQGTLDELHIELGSITICNSAVTIKNVLFYRKYNSLLQYIKLIKDENGFSKPVSLENIIFTWSSWLYATGSLVNSITDVLIDDNYSSVNIKNCIRALSKYSTVRANIFKNSDDNRMTSDYSINDGQIIEDRTILLKSSNITYSLTAEKCLIRSDSANNITPIIWEKTFGIYYYKIIIVANTKRNIGVISSEQSIDIESVNQNLPVISITNNTDFVNIPYLRIIHGTTSGNYDTQVYVPIDNLGNKLYDLGNHVVMYTKSSLASVPSYNYYSKVTLSADGSATCYGTAIPTSGTWTKGDRIINTNIATGNVKSWVCSVTGAPGTWISEGTY